MQIMNTMVLIACKVTIHQGDSFYTISRWICKWLGFL